LPAEGLLGAARLAPSGSPAESGRRSAPLRAAVEPRLSSVGGSKGCRCAVRSVNRLDEFLSGFAG